MKLGQALKWKPGSHESSTWCGPLASSCGSFAQPSSAVLPTFQSLTRTAADVICFFVYFTLFCKLQNSVLAQRSQEGEGRGLSLRTTRHCSSITNSRYCGYLSNLGKTMNPTWPWRRCFFRQRRQEPMSIVDWCVGTFHRTERLCVILTLMWTGSG